LTSALLDIPVDGERTVRVKREATALVVIDMQKWVGAFGSIYYFYFRLFDWPEASSSTRNCETTRPVSNASTPY
jgi:hypothetical protein